MYSASNVINIKKAATTVAGFNSFSISIRRSRLFISVQLFDDKATLAHRISFCSTFVTNSVLGDSTLWPVLGHVGWYSGTQTFSCVRTS